jgi:hypothetical protein
MQLEPRDKRALIGGAVVITGLLAYLLWPSREGTQSSVELVTADERRTAAGPPPATLPPAPPMQTVSAAPAAPVPVSVAVPAGAVPEGLILTGVTGSGAIFAFGDGTQRFVPRGRDVAPGITLQAVALRHVVLGSGTTSYRLGLGGGTPVAVQAAAPPSPPPPPPASPSMQVQVPVAVYQEPPPPPEPGPPGVGPQPVRRPPPR